MSVQQAKVDDPGHAPITIAIWAPATQPAGQGTPLIVISHGTGATLTSHADTARALAGAGFVVVAPLHPGDNFQDDSAVGKPAWLADRSRHVARVIDYMFATWAGRSHLVPNRVGIFGFSAGATTALISIGGVPDLGSVGPHCMKQREFVCGLMRSRRALRHRPNGRMSRVSPRRSSPLPGSASHSIRRACGT